MPKGGRKGGTQFPQVSLEDAVEYAKKLVSKTHTGPQPASVILPGVFGAGGGRGQVRVGALKQFGLLAGKPEAYRASDQAKSLSAAPPEEIQKHLQEVFLRAKVFKSLYDTFVTDTVSRAKIRQQAAALEVHPDSLEKATQLFIDGAVFAGLATPDGDNITILRPDVPTSSTQPLVVDEDEPTEESGDEPDPTDDSDDTPENPVDGAGAAAPKGPARAVASVAFSVDSSMDTDKLEKQLKLLRKYGVI